MSENSGKVQRGDVIKGLISRWVKKQDLKVKLILQPADNSLPKLAKRAARRNPLPFFNKH